MSSVKYFATSRLNLKCLEHASRSFLLTFSGKYINGFDLYEESIFVRVLLPQSNDIFNATNSSDVM